MFKFCYSVLLFILLINCIDNFPMQENRYSQANGTTQKNYKDGHSSDLERSASDDASSDAEGYSSSESDDDSDDCPPELRQKIVVGLEELKAKKKERKSLRREVIEMLEQEEAEESSDSEDEDQYKTKKSPKLVQRAKDKKRSKSRKKYKNHFTKCLANIDNSTIYWGLGTACFVTYFIHRWYTFKDDSD